MSAVPGMPAIRLLIGEMEADVRNVTVNYSAPPFGGCGIREITVQAILTDDMIEAYHERIATPDEEIIEGLQAIKDDLE